MQRKMFAIAILAAMMAPLSAFADQTVFGVPDLTCQDEAEWSLHDYGPAATGSLVAFPQDGNIEPVCANGVSTWLDHDSQECADLEAANPTAHQALCHDPRPAPFDGDLEWAMGGGWLAAESGDGVTSGSIACWGIEGHHFPGSIVYVNDITGLPVAFTVTADFTDPASPVPPDGPDCGDNVIQPCDPSPPQPADLDPPLDSLNPVIDTVNGVLYELFNSPGATCTVGDVSKPCLVRCVLDFAPGIDGVYTVFVGPTLTGGSDGGPTVATAGHIATADHPLPPIDPQDVIDQLPPAPFAGGVTITSTFGGAPTWTATPGLDCIETTAWNGFAIEVACTDAEPFVLCQKPIVSAYIYSGKGILTGRTGCGNTLTSCTANLGAPNPPFPADILSCTAQAPETLPLPMRCRAEVTQFEPFFAWAVECANDP